MSWFYLLTASLFEIVWAVSLKASDGFSRPVASLVTISAMIASFWFLALAMRVLPLGTAYAIWTGLGAVGAFTFGILFLGETLALERLIAIALIVSGLVLLKVSAMV
ncbi:MAG: multidrug efflux SMR transporter [Roseibium sp.]|uniref:DMT family transporter n=1 Tax=Roseibium sp. TaxID=1936156 RepID=UPI001B2D45FB|nr:multidrug efflux SMR transporter [Roseibium sp.]MBO6893521.1 multidrug efflux SMR transporter [Roseibium sp.]MBO6931293.1 multidrug efflux SMR transporter [Roseibium sp.]